MQLVHVTRDCEQTPWTAVPDACNPDQPPANDPAMLAAPDGSCCKVNALVSELVSRVATCVQSSPVKIHLRLAHNDPVVDGDPREVAFVIGAVMAAQLRGLDEIGGGELRLSVQTVGRRVRVSVASDEVPPLQLIRALTANVTGGDPTMMHCRRLLEAHGGTIELAEHDGRIGCDVVLPTLRKCDPHRLVPHAKNRYRDLQLAA